jgi:hypothetical protein
MSRNKPDGQIEGEREQQYVNQRTAKLIQKASPQGDRPRDGQHVWAVLLQSDLRF